MNLLNDDLKTINFQFLMLVRECARHNPMEAIWKFNLNDIEIEKISSMSLDEINDLSECGRAVLRIPPITHAPTNVASCVAAALLPVQTSTQV